MPDADLAQADRIAAILRPHYDKVRQAANDAARLAEVEAERDALAAQVAALVEGLTLARKPPASVLDFASIDMNHLPECSRLAREENARREALIAALLSDLPAAADAFMDRVAQEHAQAFSTGWDAGRAEEMERCAWIVRDAISSNEAIFAAECEAGNASEAFARERMTSQTKAILSAILALKGAPDA